MLRCKSCGAALNLSMSRCPECRTEVEMARLTGILGIVCRRCDAYNEPGGEACAGCGAPLGSGAPKNVASPIPITTATPITSSTATPSATPTTESRRTRRMERVPGPLLGNGFLGALAPGDASLVLLRGEGPVGEVHVLDADRVPAGRSGPGVAFSDDPCLAPRHATFIYRDGALWLRDERANGGVFLRLRGLSIPLRSGDFFAIGDRLLRYAGLLPPPPAAPDATRRVGSPRPASPAVVVEEVLEGGVGGRVYVRSGPRVSVGRAGCTINLPDAAHVSHVHAEIAIDAGGGARLRDLGSSNGTFVRIPPGAERELRDGDVVRIGREVLRVEVAQEEAPPLR